MFFLLKYRLNYYVVYCRIAWDALVHHPFWQGALADLSDDLDTDNLAGQSVRESVRQSIANFSVAGSLAGGGGAEGDATARSIATTVQHGGSSALGHIKVIQGEDEEGQGHLLSQMESPGTVLIYHLFY